MRLLSKTLFYFFLFSVIQLNAQDYRERQKKLEAQKISLKKEISQINNLIADSKKRSKNLANDLEDLQLKISVRDKLININNSQLNNLTSIINNQNDRISVLESDLINLKTEYEKICLLYTSPSPRDLSTSRMPSSA